MDKFQRNNIYYLESYRGGTQVHGAINGEHIGIHLNIPIKEAAAKYRFPFAVDDNTGRGFALNLDKVAGEQSFTRIQGPGFSISLSEDASILKGAYSLRALHEMGISNNGCCIAFIDTYAILLPLAPGVVAGMRRTVAAAYKVARPGSQLRPH